VKTLKQLKAVGLATVGIGLLVLLVTPFFVLDGFWEGAVFFGGMAIIAIVVGTFLTRMSRDAPTWRGKGPASNTRIEPDG
jgi:sugar phosphate permease